DIYLTGVLPVLATCMPGVSLVYGKQRQGLNLFTCLVANAGEGKHVFALAIKLLEPTSDYVHDQSAKVRKEALLSQEKIVQQKGTAGVRKKQKLSNEKNVLPPYQTLILPGNASSSALINAIADNKGCGIIFETEISSMSKVLDSEWGD